MGSVSENIMSPLYLYQNKLLVKDGKLATSDKCCCDKQDIEVAIYLCSPTNIRDNFFNVMLNGNLIGQYQPPHPGTSMLWVTNMDITKDDLCPAPALNIDPCLCENTILLNKLQIQKNDFVPGDNTLTLVTTQDNTPIPPPAPQNSGYAWVIVLRKDTFEILGGSFDGNYNNSSAVVFSGSKWQNPWELAEDNDWI